MRGGKMSEHTPCSSVRKKEGKKQLGTMSAYPGFKISPTMAVGLTRPDTGGASYRVGGSMAVKGRSKKEGGRLGGVYSQASGQTLFS